VRGRSALAQRGEALTKAKNDHMIEVLPGCVRRASVMVIGKRDAATLDHAVHRQYDGWTLPKTRAGEKVIAGGEPHRPRVSEPQGGTAAVAMQNILNQRGIVAPTVGQRNARVHTTQRKDGSTSTICGRHPCGVTRKVLPAPRWPLIATSRYARRE